MLGLVIATHGRLGAELVKTAEFILGGLDNCLSVSIDGNGSPEMMRKEIEAAIKTVNQGYGVLLLTDMFGGTPSNLSLSFLSVDEVEVLTGANLPMLIKAAQVREKMSLLEAAQAIGDYGRRSITVAGEILGRKTTAAAP